MGDHQSELSSLRTWGECRECLWSGSTPADSRQPGEELRMHEGKYASYPVCIGARGCCGLQSWIEDIFAPRTRAVGH